MENQNNNQQQEQRNDLASVRCLSLYENTTGAMQLSYLGNGFGTKYAMISIAPVFPEMVGKIPAKGDRVYDYDNRVFATIAVEEAIMLQEAIKRMTFDDDEISKQLADKKLIGDIEIGLRNGDSIRIVRGTSVADNEDFKSIMLCLSKRQPGSDEPVVANFYFKNMKQTVLTDPKVVLAEGESDEFKYEINPSFLAFCRWLEDGIEFMVGGPEYLRSVNAKAQQYRQQQQQQNYGATPNRSNRAIPGRQQAANGQQGNARNDFNNWQNGGNRRPPQSDEAPFNDYDEGGDLPF